MELEQSRPLNEPEQEMLDALLAPDFAGAAALRVQVADARVVGGCDCGCPTINIEVARSLPPAEVNRRPLTPYEGHVRPLGDEPPGEIILFVRDGYLDSLEYVWYGENPPTEWPHRERVDLIGPLT
jgi:hypothetical protein